METKSDYIITATNNHFNLPLLSRMEARLIQVSSQRVPTSSGTGGLDPQSVFYVQAVQTQKETLLHKHWPPKDVQSTWTAVDGSNAGCHSSVSLVVWPSFSVRNDWSASCALSTRRCRWREIHDVQRHAGVSCWHAAGHTPHGSDGTLGLFASLMADQSFGSPKQLHAVELFPHLVNVVSHWAENKDVPCLQ